MDMYGSGFLRKILLLFMIKTRIQGRDLGYLGQTRLSEQNRRNGKTTKRQVVLTPQLEQGPGRRRFKDTIQG